MLRPYDVGSVEGPISNVKVKKLPDGTVAFACSATTTPRGELYNPETAKKPQSSAKVYTSLFARHWDSWNTENTSSLFYGVIDRKDGQYSLRDNTIHNALAGTKLSSPVPSFGGTGDFDIGPSGLVFVAKDPELNPAVYTKTDLYYIPLKTFAESDPPSPRIVKTPGLEGYSNSPVFSHSGTKVAFTRMRSNQYESDKPRLLLVPDIAHPDKTEEFYATEDGNGGWDTRPESILWSHDDAKLYVTAEDRVRTLIVELPSTPSQAGTTLPTPLKTPDGSVRAFYLLADPSHNNEAASQTTKRNHLFITTSSLIDNACYSITDPTTSTSTVLFSASKHGKAFNLSPASISTITIPGPGGPDSYDFDALVVRPSTYSPPSTTTTTNNNHNPHQKKYPLCFLIHGGPQGAWQDSWSTRWNPAVFAEQGYVVVCPNPTGSTGSGMALQDGIRGEWGGRPYNDLVRCFEWVVGNLKEVDGERAVAAGASYGGFMISEFFFFFFRFPVSRLPGYVCWGWGGWFADDEGNRLDPGPPARAQVQGAGVPRRRVQHAEPVEQRGAVLPHPRLRGHPVRQPAGLREVGSRALSRRVGYAAVGQLTPLPPPLLSPSPTYICRQ